MLSPVYKHVFLFICGISDSLRISPIKRYLLIPHANSTQIRKILGESVIHIFLYFIVSISTVYLVSSTEWFKNLENSNSFTHYALLIAYYVFWIAPLYLATTIYTFFWFGDIANLAFEIERDYYRVKIVQAKQDIETIGANALKKIVFMLVYMLLSLSAGIILSLFPYLGQLGIVCLYSFYYSIFLFMLKWNYNPYILSFFEQNFSYFLGFGLIYSWFTNLFTGPLNDGMYWLLFPFYIFNSTCTQPPNLLETKVDSFSKLFKMIKGTSYIRDNTAYDGHLKKLSEDSQYKKQCIKKGSIFYIVRKLTNTINSMIGEYFMEQPSSSIDTSQ